MCTYSFFSIHFENMNAEIFIPLHPHSEHSFNFRRAFQTPVCSWLKTNFLSTCDLQNHRFWRSAPLESLARWWRVEMATLPMHLWCKVRMGTLTGEAPVLTAPPPILHTLLSWREGVRWRDHREGNKRKSSSSQRRSIVEQGHEPSLQLHIFVGGAAERRTLGLPSGLLPQCNVNMHELHLLIYFTVAPILSLSRSNTWRIKKIRVRTLSPNHGCVNGTSRFAEGNWLHALCRLPGLDC